MRRKNSNPLKVIIQRFLQRSLTKETSMHAVKLSSIDELVQKSLHNIDLLIEFNERTNKKSKKVVERAHKVANKSDYKKSQNYSIH